MEVGRWEFGGLLTALLQQVRRTIRRHALCPPGTRLLIALSGGSDSVALTFILRELAQNETGFGFETPSPAKPNPVSFHVVGLAHFNHRLRPTADRDEAFCRALADRLNLSITVGGADIRSFAASEHLGIEDAARRARYAFLHRVAADTAADRIAVGHTRDDQAETFLLKAVRGAGLAGLGGIYPRRDAVIRPLLDVSRAELRDYLRGRGESWMDDESNENLDAARNRIRHRVMPELDAAYGGPTAAAIARAASLAREDGAWLDELAATRYGALARIDGEGVTFPGAELAAEPAPLRRRVLLRALREVAGEREVTLEHVESAADTLGGTSAGADVPGGRVELRRGKLVLLRKR